MKYSQDGYIRTQHTFFDAIFLDIKNLEFKRFKKSEMNQVMQATTSKRFFFFPIQKVSQGLRVRARVHLSSRHVFIKSVQ